MKEKIKNRAIQNYDELLESMQIVYLYEPTDWHLQPDFWNFWYFCSPDLETQIWREKKERNQSDTMDPKTYIFTQERERETGLPWNHLQKKSSQPYFYEGGKQEQKSQHHCN